MRVCKHKHAHIHTYIHAYMSTHALMQTCMCMHEDMCTDIRVYRGTCMYSRGSSELQAKAHTEGGPDRQSLTRTQHTHMSEAWVRE